MLREEPGITTAFENLSLLLGRCKIYIWKKLDPVPHVPVLSFNWLCVYPSSKQGLSRLDNIP